MATRKKITRKKAARAAPASRALVLTEPSESALAQYSELFDPELTAGAAGGGGGLAPFIGTEDGIMRRGENVIGTELNAVVLGVSIDHALYPGRYQKGQPNNPICFYVGSDLEHAKPHASAPAPQHATCEGCLKDAFGSGQGNAKACRQSRRLLLLPWGDNVDPEADQLYRLRVPPTSIKHVSAYYEKLKSFKRPMQTVVTHIEIRGHETNRFEVVLTPIERIDGEVIVTLARRAQEGREALFSVPIADQGKKKGAAPGRRKVVRRR